MAIDAFATARWTFWTFSVRPGLVGGALEEGSPGVGALDARLDVVDEQLRNRVWLAGHKEHRQRVVGVDAGARHDLESGLGRDPSHQLDVATEEHAAWIADGADAALHHTPGTVGGHPKDLVHPHLGGGGVGRNRAHVRPLGQDGLVARPEVFVNQRRAQL